MGCESGCHLCLICKHVPKSPFERGFRSVRALIKLNHEKPKSFRTDAGYSTGSPLSDNRRSDEVCLLSAYCCLRLLLSCLLLPSTCQGKYVSKPADKGLNDGALLKVTQPVPLSMRVLDLQWVIRCSRLEAIREIKSTGCHLCRMKRWAVLGLQGYGQDEKDQTRCNITQTPD